MMHMYVSTADVPIIGISERRRLTRVKSLIRRSRVTELNIHAVEFEGPLDVAEEDG